jgi:hypothetical protein
MNVDVARQAVIDMYKSMDLQAPQIIIGDSPKHTCELAALFWTKFNKENDDEIKFDSLQNDLLTTLPNCAEGELDEALKEGNNDWYLSFWWLSWCGWYDYSKYIGVQFDEAVYNLFMNFSSEVHFIIPYEGIAFISQKPTAIHWEENNLHKDGGKAVEYSDGYGMYCLNGVVVDEYLAVTPEEQLDVEHFHTYQNADARTEFVRKFGIDRMLDFGEKVDSYENHDNEWFNKSQYELYDMSKLFEGVEYAPHLKMTNQTTGVFHVEAVAPTCRTVADAVKDRFGDRDLQIIGIA